MRLIPIVTAVLVLVTLAGFVLFREALFEFAGREPAVEAPAEAVAAAAPEAATPDTEGRVSVVVIESRSQTVENAVILRGRTEASRRVTVVAETSGTIISEPLRRGAVVAADQVLCELDPGTRAATLAEAMARLVEARARVPEAEARVLEARARLAEAEINANAATRLSADGFASSTRLANAEAALSSAEAAVSAAETGLESVKAGIQSAEASVARAEADIADLVIRAPFGGVLESDSAEFGALLNTQGGSAVCAEIIQLDPIKFVGFVPEVDIAKVSLGASAGARLGDGREVFGTVSFLSRSADLTTRTFRVEMEVANADLSIRDGQTATIGIAAEGAPAHLIPASALTLNDEGTLGVRHAVPDDQGGDVAAFAPITILRDTADGVWAMGLPEAARVIVVGQDFVTAGTPIVAHLREDAS
jgi:multidrug efflux system membrane fusion protein